MNYPAQLNKNYHKVVNYANRGMDLEELINEANNYYLEKELAVIYKKPTPIGISKVSYSNKKKVIEKSYFKEQSTLDYNGVYKGYYIDFDAKVSKSKTAFPLANIHEHQIKHIARVISQKGIAFLIIEMNSLYFLFPGNKLLDFINNEKRKSIPYEYIKNNSIIIKESIKPALKYLNAVDKLIEGEL